MNRIITSKVSSFSLVEMLVVMVLSGIVVSIIYFSFDLVSHYHLTISNRSQDLIDRSALYHYLQKDMNDAKQVHLLDDDQLHLIGKKGSVDYIFSDEYVARHQGTRTDSFQCHVTLPVYYWQGQLISQRGSVDELELDWLDFSPAVRIRIAKQYDRASLINTNLDSLLWEE